MQASNYPTTKRPGVLLLISFALCVAASSFGAMFQPGEWYDTLRLAPWNPPKLAFPIAWSVLYVMIALSGWVIFKSRQRPLIFLWLTQLAFNASWSWVFFGQRWLFAGMVIIAIIWALVLLLCKRCCMQPDLKTAGLLLIPYLCWLTLAFSLNAYIWLYN